MATRERNTLSDSTSPYLRQHADNPVHWQQWGDDALAWARERDVPVLLSVGYSACHWCHVMAHESFENDAIAEIMNANFVCIKVDREERPDIDAVYMNATVAMTGQGGWPMTAFLTPDAEPFYCGTYFPPTPRQGMPSFTQLLEAISETWRTRRDEVQQASASVVAELRRTAAGIPEGDRIVDAALLDEAVARVLADEDVPRGGFGGAPKFPPSSLVEGLLRHVERTGSEPARAAVGRTADAMARGGMYDQLGGGFARYSVDADWVVPHFEKMLYDNALLLRFYAHLARRGDAFAHRVAVDTADFLLRDLGTDDGCFASALDADTDGVEGLTYAWTPAQLVEVLGDEDGARAAQVFGVTDTGTFEEGASVLQLRAEPTDPERFARMRAALAASRATRPQPGRDDKVVTAWNGFAITALAEGGAALGYRNWVDAAARCADRILDLHRVDGRLRRASLGGVVGDAAAIAEDHGALAVALAALHQATGEARWLTAAEEVLDVALDHFADPEQPGSWFDTADDAETLVTRPRDPLDNATPSGAALITEALLTVAASSENSSRFGAAADRSLARASILLERAPRSAGHWLTVAEAAVAGPVQVAIATESVDDDLVRTARRVAAGGTVVVAGPPDSVPLLADRLLVSGESAAYVCHGFVCDRPVTDPEDLTALLVR
ncbi:thioredoxin domain-containing protein [Rhodococcus sp. BP-332]|uniref:thioredoxin domain-containing protein n=1 Tax=Rhodococcus sp. BP-332 TaxID=2739447 RepID=UPI001C9AEADB|nr:thioredoxin domain-containing protein [Rhodococcus sp. BP-332]MBY6677778.1 thioredoxin domain-containing protein [Rhodococcus sp. BP-332]